MSESSPARPEYAGSTLPPSEADVDLLCIPVFEPDDALEDVPDIDRAVDGEWRRARQTREFTCRPYELFVARVAPGTWKARRVCFVCAGQRGDLDAERMRRVAATCGYQARQRAAASVGFLIRGLAATPGVGTPGVATPGVGTPGVATPGVATPGVATPGVATPGVLAAVADGLSAAEFEPGVYKREASRPAVVPLRVAVIAPGVDPALLEAAVRRGRIQGEAANFARQLANEPGNMLTPREFTSRVARAVAGTSLSIDVLDEDRLHELGCRLLLAVSQGSAEPPRMMVLRHEPEDAPVAPVLALVGKGVTFDSGGISIKPAAGMERMKDDMSGGAAVAAAMLALARLEAPCRVIGIIPAVENMPGGRSMRPGDVVIGANGTSVEIVNTDAEGRLILADALWYARQLGATHLVDVATLTGHIVVGLGQTVAGLFGSPASWVDVVRAAAARAGDRVWPMPIYEEAREQLKSEIADLINAGGRPGGACTAAAFLREFTGGADWAHLDIAGTAWAETKKTYQPKGATGAAVRTLIELGMTGGQPTLP